MYSEFAYSQQMQALLAATSFASTFCSLYLVAGLILTFCQVPATRRQKALFAFIAGPLLHNVWTYGIFFIGGKVSFSPLAYALIVSPNPVMAFLYYLAAMRIFGLSPIRSIKMMAYVYLYWTLNTTVYSLLGSIFFPQTGPRYNYLLDAMTVITMFALFWAATKAFHYFIRKNHAKLCFVDRGMICRWKAVAVFFGRTAFVYVVNVLAPLAIPNAVALGIALNMFMVLHILFCLHSDLDSYSRQVTASQEVHISALFRGMEEFRGIKHDFGNILHTYSGYLELGEYEKLKQYHATLVETTSHASTMLDLARRTTENPPLISLLMDKLANAEKASVKLMIALQCELSDFYISRVDFCRALSCLLDNAIKAAAKSREKRIYFTCETKDLDSKLVIITNTVSGPTDTETIRGRPGADQPEHGEKGLSIVRNTLGKYVNCTFRVMQSEREFSAYMEFRGIA